MVLQSTAPQWSIQMPSVSETECVVSVLFTRGYDLAARIIFLLTGRCYTHASLGLGEQTDTFYSFNVKGFREEHPAHRQLKNGKKDSLCYQFRVSREEFEQMEHEVRRHVEQKADSCYNYFGVACSTVRIHCRFKKKSSYFCSEFVSEKLKKLKSFRLKRAAQMYMPADLARELAQQKNLYRVLVDEI
jgi:hypothetical protein